MSSPVRELTTTQLKRLSVADALTRAQLQAARTIVKETMPGSTEAETFSVLGALVEAMAVNYQTAATSSPD